MTRAPDTRTRLAARMIPSRLMAIRPNADAARTPGRGRRAREPRRSDRSPPGPSPRNSRSARRGAHAARGTQGRCQARRTPRAKQSRPAFSRGPVRRGMNYRGEPFGGREPPGHVPCLVEEMSFIFEAQESSHAQDQEASDGEGRYLLLKDDHHKVRGLLAELAESTERA